MPKSIEYEKYMMSALVTGDMVSILQAQEVIKPENITNRYYRYIYTAILKEVEQGGCPEPVSIAEHILANKRANENDIVQSMLALNELWNYTFYVLPCFKYYLLKFITQVKLKELKLLGLELSETDTIKITEYIEEVKQRLQSIQDKSVTDNLANGFDVATGLFNNLNNYDDTKRLTTGYDFDYITGGFRKKQFIIVAARPKMGKTSFALACTLKLIKKGRRVFFYSMEMDKEDLFARLVSVESGVNLEKILNPTLLRDGEMGKVTYANEYLSNLNIFIADKGKCSPAAIESDILKQRMINVNPDLVIVDGIELISGNGKYKDKFAEVSDISRQLKILTMNLEIPIMAVSQVNRECENGTNKRPRLHHLRMSGNLEQDANIVIMLYRDEVYHKDDLHNPEFSETYLEHGICEVSVEKNRNGAEGMKRMYYIPERTEFRDIEKQ